MIHFYYAFHGFQRESTLPGNSGCLKQGILNFMSNKLGINFMIANKIPVLSLSPSLSGASRKSL